jgi:hypothetical protein
MGWRGTTMTSTVSLLTVMFAAPPVLIRIGGLAPGSGQNPVV